MKRIFSILVAFAILVSVLGGCSDKIPEGTRAVKLYFANSSRDSLVSETCYIDKQCFANREDFVEAVMEKLLDGPTSGKHVAVIPNGVTLRGVSVSKTDDGVVNIDLGGEYYSKMNSDTGTSDELLARYSIVCTLCQYDGIDKIKFFVNGEHMKGAGGKGDILDPIAHTAIMMDSPSSVDTQTEKFVTLYFSDEKGDKLYPETRKATMTDNSTEKTVVNEILRGPVSEDYVRTIPDGVGLISIETTEEVCFVNLTSEFTSDLESGSEREKIAVYSIVNSLTLVPGIEKVQILIDGKKPEKDVNQLFSTPLQHNPDIIAEV
ncbi:MAG: GerMN domain-containing protein [Clostridia bacterium]|nr:GerMN domain-containing protein [Clostridia bacterium]